MASAICVDLPILRFEVVLSVTRARFREANMAAREVRLSEGESSFVLTRDTGLCFGWTTSRPSEAATFGSVYPLQNTAAPWCEWEGMISKMVCPCSPFAFGGKNIQQVVLCVQEHELLILRVVLLLQARFNPSFSRLHKTQRKKQRERQRDQPLSAFASPPCSLYVPDPGPQRQSGKIPHGCARRSAAGCRGPRRI